MVSTGQSSTRSGKRIRNLLVDSPSSIGERARQRRWQLALDRFPEIEQMRVLDLGGTVTAWERAPVQPDHVTVLNLVEPGTTDAPWLTPVEGDACDPPASVRDSTFDLVFSNSLLEHVGGHARRLSLAEVVHELAPLHWVQTPDRAFPIEPHFLFPLLQRLPIPAQASVLQHWPLIHSPPRDRDTAMQLAQWTELIGIRQMEQYFPHSEIVRERLLGLPKSLVAIKAS